MRNRPVIVAATLLCSALGTMHAQSHAVGFRVVHEFDRSRAVRPRVAWDGSRYTGEIAWPMQIGIWYPAAGRGAPMQWSDYALLSLGREGPRTIMAVDTAGAIAGIRRMAQFASIPLASDAEAAAVLRAPMHARRDATPSSGRYPVIVAGTDGNLASGARLFELLASHGYVVVAAPSLPALATLQVTRPAVAVDTRVRDLEYLVDHASRLPFADLSHLAVLGVNFDGVPALLYQMKNMRGDVVVSIDGWEGKRNGVAMVTASPYYDPARMRAAYFVIEQDEENAASSPSLDMSVFDALRYADRYYAVFEGLSHSYLVSGVASALPTITPPRLTAAERLQARVLAVFDTHLRGDVGRRAAAVDSAAPASMYERNRAARALPPIPTSGEIETMFTVQNDPQRTMRVLRDALARDPQAPLPSPETWNLYAFRRRVAGDTATAREILEFAAEAHPASATAANNLGNFLRDSGNRARAATAFQRALGLVDADQSIPTTEREQWRTVLRQKLAQLGPP
jgi:hypothetical protein